MIHSFLLVGQSNMGGRGFADRYAKGHNVDVNLIGCADGGNFKVYFKNKYGVWVHPMTEIPVEAK